MSEPQSKMPEDQEEEFVVPEDLAKAFEELSKQFLHQAAKDRKTDAELAFATADMMDCVAGYVNYAMSLAAREMNRQSPDRSINPPPDIFAHICDYLTVDERITVTHVCHYWRDLAVADARLWNHVVQNFHDSAGGRELLERSRDTPVYLELTVFANNVKAVAVLIREHVHHVKTLVLRFSDGRSGYLPQQDAWTTISYALAYPAPVLETLCINTLPVHSPYLPSCALRPDFLAGYAPELRNVSLGGIEFPTTNDLIAPFGHVTTLTYGHYNSDPITNANLVQLLTNFPCVEFLAFAAPKFFVFFPDTAPSLKFPRLRVVHSRVKEGAEACLRRIGYQYVDLAVVHCHYHANTVPIILDHTRAEKLSATLSEVAVTVRDEDKNPHEQPSFRPLNKQHERRLFDLPLATIKSLLNEPDVFRYLQTLLIHEFMWPQSGTFPPAPGLRELTVLLPTVSEHYSWVTGRNHHYPMVINEPQEIIGLFQLSSELPAPWNCASLREFRLVYGTWARPWEPQTTRTISAADLLGFVQTHLAIALPLGRIELQGVELYEAVHEIPALSGLQANCAEFVVSPSGLDPTPQQTDLWDTYIMSARKQIRHRRRP